VLKKKGAPADKIRGKIDLDVVSSSIEAETPTLDRQQKCEGGAKIVGN
jgi:hypothetical protein